MPKPKKKKDKRGGGRARRSDEDDDSAAPAGKPDWFLRQEWKEGRLPNIKITIPDIVPLFQANTLKEATTSAATASSRSRSSATFSSSSSSSSPSSRSSSPGAADEGDVPEGPSEAYQALINAADINADDLAAATGYRCNHSPTECHVVCRTKRSYEKHLLSHLMEEVRAEVQEAQKNRKVVQKLSTDSMSALLGDTRRPYPGKEKAHEEALMRILGLEDGEVVLQVPADPEAFEEWLAWLLETTTPSASKDDDAAAATGTDLEVASGVGDDAGADSGGAGNAALASSGDGSSTAATAAAGSADAEAGKSSSKRASDTTQQWNECNQRIAYHFCHYKLAQQAIVEPYNIRHHNRGHFEPDIADRTMIIHKMLTEVRAFAERVGQAAKQRLIRINRDVSVFSQQIKHTKDGMQNVRRQLDQVLNFEGRTALGPPTSAAGRGSQRKRPLKPRSQAAREQRDQIEHAKNVRAQCERDQTSFYQTYLSQISQIVAKEPIKIVNTQISESMDRLAHKVQRLLQRAEPISQERLKDIVENDAFKSYFEYQSNLLVHHAKMLKRKLSDRDEIFASLCGYTRVDPLLQAVKNTAEHIMQKEAGKLKKAQLEREKEEAAGKALREQETLLEAEKAEKARAVAKEEKRKAKQAETERKRLEAEARIKLEREAARRAKDEAEAEARAEEEREEQQRLNQRRKERQKENRERREREKSEQENAIRSNTANTVSEFLSAVEAHGKAPRISGTKEIGPSAVAAAAAAAVAVAAAGKAGEATRREAATAAGDAAATASTATATAAAKGSRKKNSNVAAASAKAAAAAAEEKTAGSDSGVEVGAAAAGQVVEDGPWEEPKKKRKPAAAPAAATPASPAAASSSSSASRKAPKIDRSSELQFPSLGGKRSSPAAHAAQAAELTSAMAHASTEAPPVESPAAPTLLPNAEVSSAAKETAAPVSMARMLDHLSENRTESLVELAAYADGKMLQSIGAAGEGQDELDAKAALDSLCERVCRAQHDPTQNPEGSKVAMYPYCFAQGSRCCAHTAFGIAAAFMRTSTPQQSAVLACSSGLAIAGSDLLNMRRPVTPEAFLRRAAGVDDGTTAKLAALPAALMVAVDWESGAGDGSAAAAAAVAESIPQILDLHAVYRRWGDAARTEPAIYTLASITCRDKAEGYTQYQADSANAGSWLQVAGGVDNMLQTPVGAWENVVAALSDAEGTQPVMLAFRRAHGR
eukprot:gene4500-32575_t